jgi:hypothetical protein
MNPITGAMVLVGLVSEWWMSLIFSGMACIYFPLMQPI